MRRFLAFITVIFLASPAAHAADRLAAGKITKANAARHVQSGPDAIGGIGDWVLSNGTLCVIIAGLENEGDFSSRGGTLRDIGFCGRDDDQFVSQQDLLNGSLGQPVEIDDIRAAVGPQRASLTTLGSYRGLMIETRYTLGLKNKTRIGIDKRIWRTDDDAAAPGILATATLNYDSMQTFLLNSRDLSKSNGFAQVAFVGRSELAYTEAARPVDTVIMVSPPDMARPVSYALRQLSAALHSGADTKKLPAFVLADSSALAFLTLTEPFTFGDGSKLGLIQLLQVPFMGLKYGDEIRLREEILVAPSANIGAFTDMIFADAPLLQGRINAGGRAARVHIDRPDGTPVTQTTPAPDGRFAVRLPVGGYRLRVLSMAGAPLMKRFTMAEKGTNLATLDLPQVARITLPRGAAMRLAFRGQGDTAQPHFEDSLTGYSITGEDGLKPVRRIGDVHLTGEANDPTHIYLADGDYKIYATRGPEYDITTSRLFVRNGEDQALRIAPPQRAVTTAGHIGADFHVHSAPSFDNAFSPTKRVRTFVAEHGEVMVAAEHDTVYDFTPLLKKMNVDDQMIAITGTEMTSTQRTPRAPFSIGHMNFFPITAKPHHHKRGLPNHENRRTRNVLDDMHFHFDNPVAQLNHPRDNLALSGPDVPEDFAKMINDEAFFDHMGVAAHPYNPHRPLTDAPNSSLIEADPLTGTRDIDFDVMEILNGTQDYRPDRVAATRKDWLSLVAQGIRLAASANSDSHDKSQQVALPRNMVRVGPDKIADFSVQRFTDAVRRGAFYGTTGPFMELRLGDAQIGDTFTGNKAVLRGRIYAADWARADNLRLQINGKTVQTQNLPANGEFEIALEFATDSFITIEAQGAAQADYQAIYPGFFPYVYSNPIYIDANKDGTWTPPGLDN
jgi:hypothetical protein